MKKALIILSVFMFISCKKENDLYDASGQFEATEVFISAETNGVIKKLDIEEGQQLNAGQYVGFIDSTQLYLTKQQLQAQVKAVLSKQPDIAAQLSSLQEQLQQAKRERDRLQNLVTHKAAPQKQLDDANSQVQIIEKQIKAQKSTLSINSSSLEQETLPLQAQIKQLNDQLKKCKIINETAGTVITKYAEANEMATIGKPLYSIAYLDTITLRAYITGTQLSQIKLNQKVKVLVDETEDNYKEYQGVIEWISDKAEFTPKTIQTKEERSNLVYAVKISVPNDGFLKIGMYGEVKF